MAVRTDLLDLALAWRPQRPSRRSPREIRDALVEPDWGGLRVVAALAGDAAVIVHDGAEVPAPDELTAALVAAFDALDALVEGYLTTAAFNTGQGAFPAAPKVDRAPLLIPRGIRKGATEDPFVRARDYESRVLRVAPGVLDSLDRGDRHAFVAADLLWLDGQALDAIPLLERKRLLEGILEPSLLVRVTPFVRSSSTQTLATWGTLGFGELHLRAANSRYLAGQENPDWAIAPAPRVGSGAPGGSATVR